VPKNQPRRAPQEHPVGSYVLTRVRSTSNSIAPPATAIPHSIPSVARSMETVTQGTSAVLVETAAGGRKIK